jgi:hypothetical protein
VLVFGCDTGGILGEAPESDDEGPRFELPPEVSSRTSAACNVTVDPPRELMIRALSVVEDPMRTAWTGPASDARTGAWTFGRLMMAMAGSGDVPTFVRSWLATWETDQTINGFVVGNRRAIRPTLTDPWLASSGGTRLDLKEAPFRLLAIVSRIDLRNLAAGLAGEARFIFGALTPTGEPLPFTVIFEYRLPAKTQADVVAWARSFHALGAIPQSDSRYNTALQAITDRFAGKNVEPTRPNGSGLRQLRTNEIVGGNEWQLREFHIAATTNQTGRLQPVTVAQTPDLTLNGSATLAAYINANEAQILAGTNVVPLRAPRPGTTTTTPFRGGAADMPFGTFLAAPGIRNNEARARLSVNTCYGCHSGETNTKFLQVTPREKEQVAFLSTFLTGETTADPVSGKNRTFNDLARRRADLVTLLCNNP